ncbi:MAG: helix-turn-helix domain-containing protein [Candidatus Faecimonas sp.]|nr:helix-turn-helix domain-containing protein [Mycoplasmatota bacterium]MDY2908324.1 helix-turn-helix domain-containing protein [Candidatus Faecimonas sp.]
MKFGENLQKLRKERGISQEQLAEQLGVTRQSVSKWESSASYPEMDKIVAICNIFHCDMDVLINKDITEERDKKDASKVVKVGFKNIADYIKKTIYLFEHQSFKDIIKMIAQVMIIICVMLCFSIPFMLFKEMVVSLFYTGDNWFSIFFSRFWNFIFNASYGILAIATFLYIFKVKFLDGEEIVIEEVNESLDTIDDDNSQDTVKDNKKKKVIKVKRTEGFSLLDLLSKAITLCLKVFLLFLLIPAIIGVIMLIIAFVLLVILIFRGLFLVGPIFIALGITVFCLIVIELILDFIFNLRFSRRRVIITIISSVVVSAVGLGLSIWYFLNLNVVNDVPNNFKQETQEEVYMMNDELLIQYGWNYIKFVEDESMTNQIRVRIDYYPDYTAAELEKEDNEIFINYDTINSIRINEVTDSIINNLKKNKLYTYDKLGTVSMTITSSKNNIEKLKENYNKQYQ